MAGGFLGLAYIAEVSIVFNLAYSELRDRRYFESAYAVINVLRNKVGQVQSISRGHSGLYVHLDNLTNDSPKERSAAWSCRDVGGLLPGISSWFLAEKAYPFFTKREDKHWASICCGGSVIVIIFSTLFDHFGLGLASETFIAYLWCISLSILLICLIYPVVTVIIGRRMMKRLNEVAQHLAEEFKKIVEPSVKESIGHDLAVANKAIEQNH